MRGEEARRRRRWRDIAGFLGARGRGTRGRGGSEQDEEEDEGEGEEGRRSEAGAGGGPGGRRTLCHCPSTHGSGAGSAVEVLGGWGMLMGGPGGGARAGETPPACLPAWIHLLCLGTPTSPRLWKPAGRVCWGQLLEVKPPRVGDYSAALQECRNIHPSHHLAGNNWERLGTTGLKTSADCSCLLPGVTRLLTHAAIPFGKR